MYQIYVKNCFNTLINFVCLEVETPSKCLCKCMSCGDSNSKSLGSVVELTPANFLETEISLGVFLPSFWVNRRTFIYYFCSEGVCTFLFLRRVLNFSDLEI